MPRSLWKLHLDSSSVESAKKVMNSCVRAFGRSPLETSLEPYQKGGYMARLEFNHNDNYTWPEIVCEVIEFGQKLGSGWRQYGDIREESIAVLNKLSGDHVSIPGLQWAEWSVLNER